MACQTSGKYKLEMVNDMAVKTGTKMTFVCVADQSTKYTLYDYKYNITGDVTLEYNGDGHLIATLTNGFISPAGSGTWPTQKPHAAPWYGDTTSPLPCWRAIAISFSLSPEIPGDASWKKCLGGWYTAGTNCNTTCTKDQYGNPPGGTYMWWSDTQAGTPWEKTQYQRGGRTIPTLTWDLGAVQPADGQDMIVYVFARAQRACTWNLPDCNNIPWVASSVPRVALVAPVCPLDPPTHLHTDQVSNVCNNCVDVTLTFQAPDATEKDGVILTVDYKYGDDDWGVAQYQSYQVSGDMTRDIEIHLDCLLPESKVCWRAQFMTTKGATAKSEYSYGCFETNFIPPAWMEVPPLSVAECTAMSQGKPIEEFTYVTNYWGNRV